MSPDHLARARFRAEQIASALNSQSKQFQAELQRSLHEVKRIHDRARKSQGQSESDSTKVYGDPKDPNVQQARKWLAPRMRLLHEAIADTCDRDDVNPDVFAELERKVQRLDSDGRHTQKRRREQ